MKSSLWISTVVAFALPLCVVVAVDTPASPVARNLTQVDYPMCEKAFFSIDLPGSDIDAKPGESFINCAPLCKVNPYCRSWTWTNQPRGTCWLKGSYAVEGVWKPGATSGFSYPCRPGVYLTILNCDMPGKDSENRPGKRYQDCKSMGSAFTWSDYNGGTCWLKSAPSACVYAPNKHSAWLLPTK